MSSSLYDQFDGFIVDIEGVIIRGEQTIEDAPRVVEALTRSKRVVFLSNISDLSREDVHWKLQRLGFEIQPDHLVTATWATVQYLREKYPNRRQCYLIGTTSFKRELMQNGFEITSETEGVDFVVVGLDYELTYEKICGAARALKNGALFIATNLAKIKLTSEGYTIGPAFTVKGLEYVTGRSAEIIGKPSEPIFKSCVNKLGLAPDRILTIGDKIEQDIRGGKGIGTRTCLVLSGATTAPDLDALEAADRPDYVISTIGELLQER